MTTIEVFQRSDGKHDWRMVADNGDVMCGTVQGYTERNDALEGFLRCAAVMIAGGWKVETVKATKTTEDAPDEALPGNDEGD